MYMKELTIQDIETIVHRDENRVNAVGLRFPEL